MHWIAGAVGIVTLLLTSGVNAPLVNKVIRTAMGGRAGPADFFTVLEVAVRAFPIVAAILVTAVVLRYANLQGWPLLSAPAVVWLVAAGLAGVGTRQPPSPTRPEAATP